MMEHRHGNILSIAGYIDVLYVWSFWSWLKSQMPREMGFECSWSGQSRISLKKDLLNTARVHNIGANAYQFWIGVVGVSRLMPWNDIC
jgi:hypothetical protein